MTPPYQHRPRAAAIALLVVIAWVAVRYWQNAGAPVVDPTLSAVPQGAEAVENVEDVERVVDGDTLLLKTGVRVRLLGINAPESVKPDSPVEPWGPEASAYMHQLVDGRKVRLQFDNEREDQYGRTLAFVWVGDTLINEEMVRAGMARTLLRFNYSEVMKDRLRAAEKEARSARRGIWSRSPPPPAKPSANIPPLRKPHEKDRPPATDKQAPATKAVRNSP